MSTKASGGIIEHKVMAFIEEARVENIRAIGKMMNLRATELNNGGMEIFSRGNSKME